MISNWEICIFVIIIIIFFFIIASVSLSLSIVNVHVLVWAGRGWVVSTQASVREVGVQACWREVWDLLNFCPKKPKLQKKKKKFYTFFLVFLSSGISQPVLLRLHLSLPGMSFAHVHRPSFVPLRSRSVASRLSLVSPQVFFHPDHCRLPADSLWFHPPARPLSVASRQFLAFAPFLVPSWHCRLPADFLWLRPRYCAIQPTVGCQPTLLRWGLNPCLYRNLVRN